MKIKINLSKPIEYHKTFLISIILSVVTIPYLWYISQGDFSWIISSVVLWALGVFIILYPTVRFIFPWLLTKVGTLSLTFILAVFSIVLNIAIFTIILTHEDREMIVSRIIHGDFIGVVTIFVWLYVVVAGTLLSSTNFKFETIAEKHREIIASLLYNKVESSTLLIRFIEVLLVFIIPIIILFWTDITYSFRVSLAILSTFVGIYIYVDSLAITNQLKKSAISIVSLFIVFIINGSFINIFGVENIPARDIKNSSINQDFQFSDNFIDNQTIVYSIVASIPEINLYMGHKVATIPNREIKVEVTDSQYTVYDEYQNKRLLTLDR